MKILVWNPIFGISHGGSRLLFNLVSAIARHQNITKITVALFPHNRITDHWDSQLLDPKVKIVYTKDNNINSTLGMQCLQENDVVYFNWPHGQKYVSINKPSVCTFQDTIILDFDQLFITSGIFNQNYLDVYKEISSSWLRSVTIPVVSSNYVKSRLISHFGTHCSSAHVIPHAILPDKISDKNIINLNRDLPENYIVYPTNISPHKNIRNLLLAYSNWSERNKYPLVLFGHETHVYEGAPDKSPFLNEQIQIVKDHLVVNQNLFGLGRISNENVIPIIKKAKALIMPSLAEGGGSYPVEEALRIGTPVICSDIPVMREHLNSHSAKIVWINANTAEGILQGLNEMILNFDKYKSSTLKGTDDPGETWDDIAKKYIQVFQEAFVKHWKL